MMGLIRGRGESVEMTLELNGKKFVEWEKWGLMWMLKRDANVTSKKWGMNGNGRCCGHGCTIILK